MLAEKSGISIMAVDPGGTTGVAVYDCWDDKLYVDQIDSGRGLFYKAHMHNARIESAVRRHAERELELDEFYAGIRGDPSERNTLTWAALKRVNAGRGRGKERIGELELLNMVERGTANLLNIVALAMGPGGFMVMEDFIIGWGESGYVGSSDREGLSPVRIATRFDDRCHEHGLVNGDAWRVWRGHGWLGEDKRGWHVKGDGSIPSFYDRMRAVERWLTTGKCVPLRGVHEELTGALDHVCKHCDQPIDPYATALWQGRGNKLVLQMPNERLFLSGGKAQMQVWLREREQWFSSRPHGMDALMHLLALSRKLGLDVRQKPNVIWTGRISRGKRAIKP